MAWIESHQELARHPKTKRLARELGESVRASIGLLHMLWWWAMDYAETGDLSRYTAEDIADAVFWDDDPTVLMASLQSSGFIDCDESGMWLHDWNDYAGRLVEQREKNKERKRRSRANRENVTRPSRGQERDDLDGHRATVPNRTEPDQTKEPTTTTTRVDELDRLIDAYQKGGFGQADPMFTQQALEADLEEYGFEWTIEAMRRAVKRGKRTLAYVEAILKDWRANGGMDSGDGDKSPPKNRGHSRTDKSSAAAADERYGNFYRQAGSG